MTHVIIFLCLALLSNIWEKKRLFSVLQYFTLRIASIQNTSVSESVAFGSMVQWLVLLTHTWYEF